MVDIEEWSNLASDHADALLLGNGASIAIDGSFSYTALLGAAREDGLIGSELEEIFKYVQVPDFELVLTMLWHAFHVNTALGVKEGKTTAAYKAIREALIATVRTHHAGFHDVEHCLGPAADFMKGFRTVVSLNYDLIVYWTLLEGNHRFGTWFKDAFLNGKFVHSWEYLRAPFNAPGATMVFYPHGNLALVTELSGGERN